MIFNDYFDNWILEKIVVYHNLTHDYLKDRKDVCDKYEKIMKERIFTLEKNVNEKLTNEFCLFINDITNISSSYHTSYKDKLM